MRRFGQFVLPLPVLLLVGCATLQSTSNTHGPAARSIAHPSHAMTITFLIPTVVMWLLLAIALKKRRGTFEEHMPIDVGGGQRGWSLAAWPYRCWCSLYFSFSASNYSQTFQSTGASRHGLHGRRSHCQAGHSCHRTPVVAGGPVSQHGPESAGHNGQRDSYSRAQGRQHRTTLRRRHALILGPQSPRQG